MLRHRPKLELYCSTEILCGQELVAMVRIIAIKPVQATGLWATLVGREEARFGSGEYVRRSSKRAPQLFVEIIGRSEIAAGQHEHQLRMHIPADYAPSYIGQRCSTRYFLSLRLGLHRWFDRRARFEVALGLAQGLSPYPGQPAIFASRSGGPEAKKAYLEGSVANDVLAPGDVLRGAVALSNTSYNRYLRIVVALVGTEILHDKRSREDREVRRLSIDVDTRSPAEGESFPLAMKVPGNLAPSANAQLWSLQWALEIVARVRLGRDVSIRLPVTVVPASNLLNSAIVRAPPSVGSARMRALWQAVARDQGLEFLGANITGVVNDVSLSISREHRGRRGWLVVARMRYAPLGLGVRIEESSLLRGTGFGGIKIGTAKWRKQHHVRARRPEQGAPFFALLEEAITAFAFVAMDDDELGVIMEDSGLRVARLREFVASTIRLAETLSQARSKIEVPAEFSPFHKAWQQFAASLSGTLEHGDMSIRGQLQGLRVETLHSWSDTGELTQSSMSLGGLARLDEQHCFHLKGIDRALGHEDIAMRPESEQSVLRSVAFGALEFSVESEEIALVLPPTHTPGAFQERLPALLQMALNRGGAGPYR